MLDYLIFIGRFTPLHNGHVHVIKKALEQAKKVIILVGSANTARNTRNPFTFDERWDMIAQTFPNDIVTRIDVCPINDYPYNDNQWVAEVQKTVGLVTSMDTTIREPKIGLIGYSKDHTSYYLKMFPMWQSVNVDAQFSTLNSSDIRNQYFQDFFRLPDKEHCPYAVIKFMYRFTGTQEFQWLVAANKYIKTYNPKEYDVIVSCVDAVVVQSGHILLVTRKNHPGKGLLALPGGHVNIWERHEDAVLRELKEEAHPSDDKGELPPAMLRSFITKEKFFDDPNRSLWARVTSMAYLFELPARKKLFSVRGDDDAEKAQWYLLGNLKSELFHDDHYHIINTMLGK